MKKKKETEGLIHLNITKIPAMCFESHLTTQSRKLMPCSSEGTLFTTKCRFAYGKYFLLLKSNANSHTNSSVNSKGEHLATP